MNDEEHVNYYVPTQEQIRDHCKEIRSTWDKGKRNRRICDPKLRVAHWSVPEMNARELGLDDDLSEMM